MSNAQVIQLNQLRVHGNVINMVLTTWKKVLDSQTAINQDTVRKSGPLLILSSGLSVRPGGYCDYTEVMLQDGHVWVGYTWEGQRYYLPIRTWNGSAPPNQILGDLWERWVK